MYIYIYIFEIIYYLISGDTFPLFVYIFFVVVESFQIFYFAFSTEVPHLNTVVPINVEDPLVE
jgi:hypothetical protein